jgi:hypothetical protein
MPSIGENEARVGMPNIQLWRMSSSGMCNCVDLMWTDILQPPAHADSSTLKMEAIRSSETSVHTRSTKCHISEDCILHSHRCENLKSYISAVFRKFQPFWEVLLPRRDPSPKLSVKWFSFCGNNAVFIVFDISYESSKPPLWSSGQNFWLQIQISQVRFQTLPEFMRSRGSGTGSTQPREDNWGVTWKCSSSGLENRD